jgi:hypothetical protein
MAQVVPVLAPRERGAAFQAGSAMTPQSDGAADAGPPRGLVEAVVAVVVAEAAHTVAAAVAFVPVAEAAHIVAAAAADTVVAEAAAAVVGEQAAQVQHLDLCRNVCSRWHRRG